MCGIVGLHLKNPDVQPRLGEFRGIRRILIVRCRVSKHCPLCLKPSRNRHPQTDNRHCRPHCLRHTRRDYLITPERSKRPNGACTCRTPRPSCGERAESDGVRFFFAMFVDMHGKPCAKMIPIEAVDVLTGGGAGFAGFAAGPMGQSPADPDMIAVPGPGLLHARAVAAGAGRAAVRHPRRGRALAVHPAADPEADAGEGPRARPGLQRRLRGGVLPRPAPRRRRRGAGRPARHRRGALLRRQGPDPDVRPPDHGVEVHEPARLGELRQRPRGRERPVRAELRLRRRADQRRPAHLLPLHGPHAGAQTRAWRPPSCPSRSGT